MKIGTTEFSWGLRTFVMGVVNVTPDSFSGDGTISGATTDRRWVDAAVEQAKRMEVEGADVIDVGGESTRPPAFYAGAEPVSADAECSRVLPVIEALIKRLSVPVSIDTRKADVARVAVSAGAALINDVSMLGDPEMAATAAAMDVPLVISHTRAKARYANPALEIADDLAEAVALAVAAGVSRNRIIADPGIGFGKTARHSLAALRELQSLKERLSLPVLVGTSRKSFIGSVLDLPVDDRLEGTAATMALAVAAGADMVRVHDVKEMARVVKMADAVVRGWEPDPAP